MGLKGKGKSILCRENSLSMSPKEKHRTECEGNYRQFPFLGGRPVSATAERAAWLMGKAGNRTEGLPALSIEGGGR